MFPYNSARDAASKRRITEGLCMIKKVLGACVLALLSSGAIAAGNDEAGRVKANTCMGCHGIPNYTNVYPTYRVPRLGGQSEDLIVSALKAYKSGDRPHQTMHAPG